jgi:hypothetical protein
MSIESCQKRFKSSKEVLSKESKVNNPHFKKKNLFDNLVYGSFWGNQPNPQLCSSVSILLAPALSESMKAKGK